MILVSVVAERSTRSAVGNNEVINYVQYGNHNNWAN